MRVITLTICSADGERHLATLEWRDGRLYAPHLVEELVPALVRWREQGVSEWVAGAGERGRDRFARITPVTDPLFLSRLADHLKRQFRFSTSIESQMVEARPVVRGRLENQAQIIALASNTQAGALLFGAQRASG